MTLKQRFFQAVKAKMDEIPEKTNVSTVAEVQPTPSAGLPTTEERLKAIEDGLVEIAGMVVMNLD